MTYSFFADDIVLFRIGDEWTFQSVEFVFDSFYSLSSQAISLSKSPFCTFRNFPQQTIQFFQETLGINYNTSFGKYGFPVPDITLKSADV